MYTLPSDRKRTNMIRKPDTMSNVPVRLRLMGARQAAAGSRESKSMTRSRPAGFFDPLYRYRQTGTIRLSAPARRSNKGAALPMGCQLRPKRKYRLVAFTVA